MKAISIRQPWAWAILHAGKRVENRDWRGCSYRGPLLIHAAKGCTFNEYMDAAYWMASKRLASPHWLSQKHIPTIPPMSEMGRGGILGYCRLVDVVTASRDPWFCGLLGLVLADVRPLPYVPFKGALGLFEVPDELVLPLLAQPSPNEARS
jgi:hypothetical protein